jgi:sensor histidine kinase regulating citrate/malate metabolism
VTSADSKRLRNNISIWVVIGAILVVAIISAVMTLVHFQRQKEQAIELLIEKGATLIRSFEAGMRDRTDIKDNTFHLQKLLIETASQPDIDYIIVADANGNIIADSDPSLVGEKYGLDLDGAKIFSGGKQPIPAGRELLRSIAVSSPMKDSETKVNRLKTKQKSKKIN